MAKAAQGVIRHDDGTCWPYQQLNAGSSTPTPGLRKLAVPQNRVVAADPRPVQDLGTGCAHHLGPSPGATLEALLQGPGAQVVAGRLTRGPGRRSARDAQGEGDDRPEPLGMAYAHGRGKARAVPSLERLHPGLTRRGGRRGHILVVG